MSTQESIRRLQDATRDRVAFLARGPVTIALTAVVLALFPFVLGFLGVSLSFGIELLIFALAGYGVLIVFGYVGMLSFGHAAFFGLGSFTLTLMLNNTQIPLVVVLAAAIVVSLLFGVVMGYVSIQQSGIYFAIITLAFAEVLRLVALYPLSDITGGQNGLPGAIIRPPIDLGIVSFDPNDAIVLYALIAVLAILWLITFRQILYSQTGRAFLAVRENEDRARSIGYDVQRIKLKAFVVSGGITGLAGGIYALYLGYSGVSHLHWSLSGDFLFIALIGGAYNFMGTFIGAGVFRGLNFFLSNIEWWPLIVGTILILTVHFAPEGILGTLQRDD